MIILLYSVFLVIAAIALVIAFVYLSPERAVAMALNATRKHAGLKRKEITLANGLHYAYLEGGQGEALLLLHGFGANKDIFTPVARLLVKHYRVIIPDIIGFGESAHPDKADYSPLLQVERLRELSQALNLKNLHIGGNSMGGQIALLYAARYPAEVKSLWLLSPAGIWSSPKSEVLRIITDSGHNPLIARNEKEFKGVMALGMSKPPFIPKPMLKVLAQERIQNAVLEEHIFHEIIKHSVEEQIAGMQIPSLIVFGEQDRVIPVETAKVLSKLLPNSNVILVQNAGHVPMFERPQQCANDYLSFRESLPESQSNATANNQ